MLTDRSNMQHVPPFFSVHMYQFRSLPGVTLGVPQISLNGSKTKHFQDYWYYNFSPSKNLHACHTPVPDFSSWWTWASFLLHHSNEAAPQIPRTCCLECELIKKYTKINLTFYDDKKRQETGDIRNMVWNCIGIRFKPPYGLASLCSLAQTMWLKSGSVPNESKILILHLKEGEKRNMWLQLNFLLGSKWMVQASSHIYAYSAILK